ncbi:MAG: CHAD domain-containing protein [Candidatus Eisenbacteria bacterium]
MLVPASGDVADLARELRAAMLRRAARLMRTASRVRQDQDPGAVHDLRVAIRRLEAALFVWQRLLAAKPLRRTMRTLRSLRRKAGATRESELHAMLIRTHLEAAPAEFRDALEHVIEMLEERRNLDATKLRVRVAPWRIERLTRRLRRTLRPLASALPFVHDPERDALARVEQQRRRALTALLEAHPSASDTALHEARLWVKRWRYAEEALTAAGGPEIAGDETLRELQQVLGEIQDRATLRVRALELVNEQVRRDNTSGAAALQWLITQLESERLDAVERFRSRPQPVDRGSPA